MTDKADLDSGADLGNPHVSDTPILDRALSRGGCRPRHTAAIFLAAAAALCLPAVVPAAPQDEIALQSETVSAGPYDGTWSGTTGQGKAISFTIANNAVSVFTIGYLTSVSPCQQNSSVTYTYNPPRPFVGNSFSIEEIHAPGLSVGVAAFFDSGTSAWGAASFVFTDAFGCYTDGSTDWTATNRIVIESSNLAPYQPAGWSDKIVVSKTTGTNSDSSPLAPTDALYVDWAVVNNGFQTSARFFTELYVDGSRRQSWYTDPPLDSNTYTQVLDFPIGTLALGAHTIRIRTDSTNEIAESNEGDNEYTKTITIGGGGPPHCTVDATTLCLNSGRFQVRVIFSAPSLGISNAPAQAVPLTSDTGYFWFFSSTNVEIIVKVIDGCSFNNRFWVFSGGLTNVAYTITVTDPLTGSVRTYSNPQGTPSQPVQDTNAFGCAVG